jgi:RsiW-degrading membrane proteinase PrsW (M82 family)
MFDPFWIFACGSMRGLVPVLVFVVILLVIGGMLWPVNLCLALGLTKESQKVNNFVFVLLCAAAGVIVYAMSQSENYSIGLLLLGVLVLPVVVIAHFMYLVILRRRQRDHLLKRFSAPSKFWPFVT